VIWGSTSLRVLEKPLLGHGLASTRVLDEMARPLQGKLAGTDISDGTNMHAHNVFLQAWYETGAIGGVLLFLAGLPVLGWLRARSDRTAPYLFAAFAASVVVASLSWSLVASWYIATFGLVAVWCRFADLFVADVSSSDP
jgi:O-antigen ligase